MTCWPTKLSNHRTSTLDPNMNRELYKAIAAFISGTEAVQKAIWRGWHPPYDTHPPEVSLSGSAIFLLKASPQGRQVVRHGYQRRAPQAIINRQLLEDADIVIGIFGTKIGTPTEQYISGTVEEIKRHVARGRTAKLYFSDVPVSPSQVNEKQLALLRSFKEKCPEQRPVCDL